MIIAKPIALIALLFLALLWWAWPSHAHEWYKNTGCCSGSDCAAVPLDADWVQPTKGGYQVDLTAEQAALINPEAHLPVHEFIEGTRVRMPPAKAMGDPALYHLCIPSGFSGVYCLFVVPGM